MVFLTKWTLPKDDGNGATDNTKKSAANNGSLSFLFFLFFLFFHDVLPLEPVSFSFLDKFQKAVSASASNPNNLMSLLPRYILYDEKLFCSKIIAISKHIFFRIQNVRGGNPLLMYQGCSLKLMKVIMGTVQGQDRSHGSRFLTLQRSCSPVFAP